MRRARKSLVVAALMSSLVFAAAPALGDDYDSRGSGHPLRIAAYVLHPVGLILDTLIFRPAHWLGSLGPIEKFFGHED